MLGNVYRVITSVRLEIRLFYQFSLHRYIYQIYQIYQEVVLMTASGNDWNYVTL